MSIEYGKGSAMRNILRWTSFAVIGISSFSNPLDPFNRYNLIFGFILGMLLGILFRVFLSMFLGTVNSELKKEEGKAAIKYAIDNGMLFLIPFAVMVGVATFGLKWSMTLPFISAGLMAVGTASAIEVSKLKGKSDIKSTISTSVVSFSFSFLWTLGYPVLLKATGILQGGIELIISITKGGL